jgi:hypothetical protein
MCKRSKYSLKVKRGCAGLGLFTECDIQRGDFIIEYCGPLLTDEQSDEKGGKYLFKVPDSLWTIDGSSRSNLARYINHSCKPNCEAIADGNRILIHARRNIRAGEELHYDYGKEYMEDMIKEGKCLCGHCGRH